MIPRKFFSFLEKVVFRFVIFNIFFAYLRCHIFWYLVYFFSEITTDFLFYWARFTQTLHAYAMFNLYSIKNACRSSRYCSRVILLFSIDEIMICFTYYKKQWGCKTSKMIFHPMNHKVYNYTILMRLTDNRHIFLLIFCLVISLNLTKFDQDQIFSWWQL